MREDKRNTGRSNENQREDERKYNSLWDSPFFKKAMQDFEEDMGDPFDFNTTEWEATPRNWDNTPLEWHIPNLEKEEELLAFQYWGAPSMELKPEKWEEPTDKPQHSGNENNV